MEQTFDRDITIDLLECIVCHLAKREIHYLKYIGPAATKLIDDNIERLWNLAHKSCGQCDRIRNIPVSITDVSILHITCFGDYCSECQQMPCAESNSYERMEHLLTEYITRNNTWEEPYYNTYTYPRYNYTLEQIQFFEQLFAEDDLKY